MNKEEVLETCLSCIEEHALQYIRNNGYGKGTMVLDHLGYLGSVKKYLKENLK